MLKLSFLLDCAGIYFYSNLNLLELCFILVTLHNPPQNIGLDESTYQASLLNLALLNVVYQSE